MNKFSSYCNKKYYQIKPLVSIITSNYNRRDELERAIESIKNQTYQSIEYILVDDGSTINTDDIAHKYLHEEQIPMMYIKKDYNEGVTRGRNIGISQARGKYLCFLDSDDELINNAIELLVRVWEKFSASEYKKYREVVGLCIDENGNCVGEKFPKGINEIDNSRKAYRLAKKGERFSLSRSDLVKEVMWPEPEGVVFVAEEILWGVLEKYKGYFINEQVRIYHTEQNDSFTNTKQKTPQYFVNLMWNNQYVLNNYEMYKWGIKRYLQSAAIYMASSEILRKVDRYPTFSWVKENKSTGFKFLSVLLKLPANIVASQYIKRKGLKM